MFTKRALILVAFLAISGVAHAQQLIKTTMHWTRKNTTYDFLGNGEFKVDKNNMIDGQINWSIKEADKTSYNYYRDKMNATGIEYVKGSYDPTNKRIMVQGYAKADASAIIGLDTYQIDLTGSYQVSGVTKASGNWDGIVNGTYTVIPITDK